MWVLRLNLSYCKIIQEEKWDPAFASTCHSREHLEELLSTGAYSYSMPQQIGSCARVSAVSTKDILKCWRGPQPFMCWGENISEGEHSVAVLESCWVYSFEEYSWCICVDSFRTAGTRDSLAKWTVFIFLWLGSSILFLIIFRLFWFRSLIVIMISCNIVTSLAIDRQLTKQMNSYKLCFNS